LAGIALGGATPVSQLRVDIDQMRNSRGTLRLCLTADPENFPNCVDDARAVTRSVAASERAIRFDGLPHGGYALAVIHDENDNARLDTFAGIPREGFGFSRNPRIGFGPPRFNSARFAVEQATAQQRVTMRYML
jgi:uncharacterized protein (DUF2141 family)